MTGPHVVVVRGGRNLLTPHAARDYPGLEVIRPGRWDLSLICPEVGQTVVALGGEHAHAYRTVDGGEAEAFELRPGDRATLLRRDLPFCFSEWRIVRHPS